MKMTLLGMRGFASAILCYCVLLSCSDACALEIPSKLVNTEWLEKNLANHTLRIIDIRDDVSQYCQGHIPGAVYFNPQAMQLADGGAPAKLMPVEALVIMLGRMGITPNTTVIVYSAKNDYDAAYFIWALDCIGHRSSALLEGGFAKWAIEARPLSQDYPSILTYEYPRVLNALRRVMATLKHVADRGGNTVLLDVRTLEFYNGEKGYWKRKGHIKGARHHFWGDDLKGDGTWKDKEELEKTYADIGATPRKDIIVYSSRGLESAHTYFTLKYVLGFPYVKNYDGGFDEWSNAAELPVETGADN